MSVLRTVEAVPSRVAGLVRYLLRCPRQREDRDRLEAALSPASLRSEQRDTPMVREVVLECHRLGLTVADGGDVRLADLVCERMGRGRFNDSTYRDTLVDLLLGDPNGENGDLAKLLTWFLAQDPARFDGEQTAVIQQVREQLGADALAINDNVFRDFRYWGVYLGFAKVLALPARGERLLPDPTPYIERSLPALFFEGRRQQVGLPEMLSRLAARCPAFDGGRVYDELRAFLPSRPDGHAAWSLSLALLRLHGRGLIQLSIQSDAPSVVLLDGLAQERFTHAAWAGAARGGQ